MTGGWRHPPPPTCCVMQEQRKHYFYPTPLVPLCSQLTPVALLQAQSTPTLCMSITWSTFFRKCHNNHWPAIINNSLNWLCAWIQYTTCQPKQLLTQHSHFKTKICFWQISPHIGTWFVDKPQQNLLNCYPTAIRISVICSTYNKQIAILWSI